MASRLVRLIQTLLKEQNIKQVQIPESIEDQALLYQALQNVRYPAPISPSFLYEQDRYLQEELLKKGQVDLVDLVAVEPGIYLWQGDITRLKVDVIVNAANCQMLGCFVPNHRCIDNAIHTAAGVQLRLECQALMQAQGQEEATGQAKITKAYNLPSAYVIHTVGPIIYDQVTDLEIAQLASSYRESLALALERRLTSIAFPCISTGEFHFPQEEAAQIALATVREFLKDHPQLKVIFNVFKDRDLAIYQNFLEK